MRLVGQHQPPLGKGLPIDRWLYEEADRILQAYGNHPSFLLLPYGNEPAGDDRRYLGEWVEHYKKRDPRRLYSSAAGWPQIPENQFHVTPDPRIQAWGGGLKSRINARPPETADRLPRLHPRPAGAGDQPRDRPVVRVPELRRDAEVHGATSSRGTSRSSATSLDRPSHGRPGPASSCWPPANCRRCATRRTSSRPCGRRAWAGSSCWTCTTSRAKALCCATGDLDITDDLTITGKGATKTFVNGGKLDRVFHIIGPISVTVMNVSIQNGLARDDGYGDVNNVNGGAILNESASTLTLKGITISNNTASGGVNGSGGGIYNSGTLAITKSTLFNNAVSGGSEGVVGGAIYNAGTVKIISTTLSNNIASGPKLGFGGAILNRDIGILEIQGSNISNNTVSVQGSYGEGGGISNGGSLTIMKSTISNNTAQGVNGDGGGIANGTWGGQEVTITKSIISNNVARGPFAKGGGIVSFAGEVVITGSTLSDNAASAVSGNPGRGGGIFVGDYTTVTVQGASKIVLNFSSDEGGGICYGGAGTGSVSADSIVAKNIPDDIYDVYP